MATYTTNLNLKKPAQSDKIRIADINNNMDDIDAAFGAIGNDSVATQIRDIQDAVAIVAVGDSHAAVTAGEFVYVKSHETLDVGLYKATANIAQNAALSSSNLTAESSGGLNALNSKIGNKTDYKELNLTTYAHNTVAGVEALFAALPSQYYGLALCRFANSITGIAMINKLNGNYGSYIIIFDDNTNPIHGVHNGTSNYIVWKISRESV